MTPDEARTVFTGRTILVVDDKDTVRGVLRAVFEDAGATVLDAANLRHARSILDESESSPDAVVTDLELTPDWRGGVAVLEQAKRRSPSCPVLLLTAWSDEIERLRALGFDGVLLKPTSPADLLTAVAGVIQRSGRDSQDKSITAA